MTDDFTAVWKYGPNGEIKLGKIKHKGVWLCIGAMLVIEFGSIWMGLYSFATVGPYIIVYAGIFIARLSRLEGDDDFILKLGKHWGEVLCVPVGALVLCYWWFNNGGGKAAGLLTVASLAAMAICAMYFTAPRLMQWEPTDSAGDNPFAVSDPADEARMYRRMEQDYEHLKDLPEPPEGSDPELESAFQARDLEKISNMLHECNEGSRNIWMFANDALNRALQYRDIEARMLFMVSWAAEEMLAGRTPDYKTAMAKAGKRARSEMGQLIAGNLSGRSINTRRTALLRGGANAFAQGLLGRAPPAIAIVAIAGAFVADQVYKSRTLRRLKDTEGEVMKALKTVLADCKQVETLLATRFLPDFKRMMEVSRKFDEMIGWMEPSHLADPKNERWSHEVRMAVLEAKQLLKAAEAV